MAACRQPGTMLRMKNGFPPDYRKSVASKFYLYLYCFLYVNKNIFISFNIWCVQTAPDIVGLCDDFVPPSECGDYSPSPSGGFAQKFKIERKIARHKALNQQSVNVKTDFLGKAPSGEGGVRVKVEAWSALAGPIPPDAEADTAITLRKWEGGRRDSAEGVGL
jgi:hypothetical protein